MTNNATIKRIVAIWMIFCMSISFMSFSVMAVNEDTDIKTNGKIVFEGFTFEYMADNSIQATVDVYVDNLRMTDMTIGLNYKNYIVPSDLSTNIATTDIEKMFKLDSQFEKYFELVPYVSGINSTEQMVNIYLHLDQALLEEEYRDKGVTDTDVITNVLYSRPETIDLWHINAYTSDQTHLKIGTMSFRVTKPAQLINVPSNEIPDRVLASVDADTNPDGMATCAIFSGKNSLYDELIMNSEVVVEIDASRTDARPTVPRKTVSAYTVYKNCYDTSRAGTVDALIEYLNRNMSRVMVMRASGQQKIEELINWTLSDSDPQYNATIKYVNGIVPMYEASFADARVLDVNHLYDPVSYPDGYNPKGNVTYMITQPYLKDTEQQITVFLTVTPSELTGFRYDRRIIVFRDFMTHTWDDLKMPTPITAIVTGVDDEYIPPTATPQAPDDWDYVDDFGTVDPDANTGLNKLNSATGVVMAEFITEFPKDELINEPWLTIPDDFNWNVDAYRYVTGGEVEPPNPPEDDDDDSDTDINAYILFDKDDVNTDIPGRLIIEVNKLGGQTIADNTKFNIYLPNGWVLSSDESYVDVQISGGKAVITVSAMDLSMQSDDDNFTLDRRRKIQSLINLGSSKDFRLSELLPNADPLLDYAIESPLYPFSFDKRYNRYLDDDVYFEYYVKEDHTLIAPDPVSVSADPETVGYILKDYSDGRSDMFPVYKGQSLREIASYIDFPDDSTIPVMYHGKDGYQPAELGSAKVIKDDSGIAWRILGDESLDVIPSDTEGDIILVGTLEPYSYTNFGYVNNPQNVKLYLKVTPLDSVSTPTPTPPVDPTPTPSPDPDASPTPVPGEAIEISTKVPPPGVYKVVLNNKTFQYDKKNEGYTEAQHQKFTIKNIGSVDIPGLTMRIADLRDSSGNLVYPEGSKTVNGSGDNFVDSIPLDYTKLDKDKTLNKLYSEKYNEIDVEIRPLVSLPVGTYKARVIVGSRTNDDLAHFDIEFTVVPEDTKLYKITVDNYVETENPASGLSDIGIAYLTDPTGTTVYSNYLEEGESVTANAVVLDTEGYVFDHWLRWTTGDSLGNNADDWTDEPDNPITFNMPAHDTTIKPIFLETPYLWLRLAALEDYTILDFNDRDTDRKNDLRDIPSHIIETDPQFSERRHTYYVIVDEKEEDNYVKFGLKIWEDHDIEYTITLRYDDDPTKTEHDIKDAADLGTPNDTNTVNMFKSQDFKLHEGYNYVTITTTYTEDGTEYKQTYKIIIHRRKSIVDVEFRPGNSPYGLIAGSDDFATDDDKAEAKKKFSENHSFISFKDETKDDGTTESVYTSEFTPSFAENTYKSYYSVEAWMDWFTYIDPNYNSDKNPNYDERDDALFVYNRTVFIDPGFSSLKNDDGSQVKSSTVSREINNLIVLQDGYVPTVEDLVSIGDTSSLPAGMSVVKSVSVDAAGINDDGSCYIGELQNYNVLPGVYAITYRYKDNTGIAASFDRPLIILPEKGDVNLSGTTDDTDADILYQRLNDLNEGKTEEDGSALPYKSFCSEIIEGEEQWQRLLSYRVGDVNEDRNVNSLDANANHNGVTFARYYEPLPTDNTGKEWPGMAEVSDRSVFTYTAPDQPPEDKPILVMDMLGTGSTPTLKQPASISVSEYDDDNSGRVWLGVGVRNPEKLDYFLKNGVYSVDIAIDYDPDIFEPCDAEGRVEGDEYYDILDTLEEANIAPSYITVYNTDVGYWKNAEIYKPSFKTHLDMDEEDFGGDTKINRYKSTFITIRALDSDSLRLEGLTNITNRQNAATELDTIYFLRIPFRLKKRPPEGYQGEPITIRAITEQTFVLGGTENGVTEGASWEGKTDKTIADTRGVKVLNAFNHFDGIEVVDMFDTDTRFTLKGVLRGWNPLQPFRIKLYRTDKEYEPGDPPEQTFSSIDENGYYANGVTTVTSADGEVMWEYELEDIFEADYRVEIEKQSHLTYPYMYIKASDIDLNDATLTVQDEKTLIVGDINLDGFIKLPDRAYLINMFNQSRPWTAELRDRFDKNDLNGDRRVNLFDLNLLNKNMEKSYSIPADEPPAANEGGGG